MLSESSPAKINKMPVHSATEENHPDIIKLVKSIALQSPDKRAQFNWDRFQIRDELKKANCLVYNDGGIKSFLCFRETDDFLEITVLATAPDARNRGYQSAVMNEFKNLAFQKNKNILLEVHEENEGAIRFYRKLGFVELPARKNYYTDGKSALVFKMSVE
jgi:ribosomal-protein-alanine N-acetyltransferase